MRQTALTTVYELAKLDSRVVFIGSDLGAGTLEQMRSELPKQFFMEGISEQHVVGFAAGLAQEGFIPFVNTIGTFLTRRSFEQVSIDVGLHNLPVRLLASGGGMVYAPLGPTHTAIEDLSLMLSVPNVKVFAPTDSIEMQRLLHASIEDSAPYYIRFGKGGESIVTESFDSFDFQPKIFGNGTGEVVLLTTGVMVQHSLEAKKILSAAGISSVVVHFPYLNNLNIGMLSSLIDSAEILICIEEHVPRGGLLTQVLHSFMETRQFKSNLYQLSLPSGFTHNYGSQLDHLEMHGLTGKGIASNAMELLKSKRS